MTPLDERSAGLCATCAHVRLQRNDRGSAFLRCARAESDPRYRKYPPLPVLSCAGHEASTNPSDSNANTRTDPL